MALRPALDRSESDVARRTLEMKKKGWSDSKIARWIEQKHLTVERNSRVMEQRRRDLRQHSPADVDQWIEFLRALVSGGAARYCAILYHFYSGGLETEKIKLRRRVRKTANDITRDDLLTLEEDVVLEVDARRQKAEQRADDPSESTHAWRV